MNLEKFFLKHTELYNFLKSLKFDLLYTDFAKIIKARKLSDEIQDQIFLCNDRYKNKIIKFFDFKMKIQCKNIHDLGFYYLYKNKKIYEPGVTYLIKSKLNSSEIFVDVGANNGYYSLLASKIVGKKGIVYSIEPDPQNFKKLIENIRLNKIKNIIPIQTAVGDKIGKALLNRSPIEDGQNSLLDLQGSKEHIEININLLDNLINKADMIKIDVEGYEENVLIGSKKLLNKVKRLIFEYNLGFIYKGNKNYNGTINILKRKGFHLFQIYDTPPYININHEINSVADLDNFFTNIFATKIKSDYK
ncbi:MAG: FkbM family methyltransferase [Minisyncoccia bacterium]